MLTSPRQYACNLANKLIGEGAKPVWVPGIEITDLRDPHQQQACPVAHQCSSRRIHAPLPDLMCPLTVSLEQPRILWCYSAQSARPFHA